MQQQTTSTQDQPIRFNDSTERWAAYVGTTCVGDDFASPAEAQQARADYLILHPEEQPAPDTEEQNALAIAALDEALEGTGETHPLTLFAPIGLIPGLPITDGMLERAYAQFLAEYGDKPKVMDRAYRALTLAQNKDAWEIPQPGVLRVRGSRPNQRYLVRDLRMEDQTDTVRDCTQQHLDSDSNVLKQFPCPDHAGRMELHGGLCKHLICRELIRLAQIFSRMAAATSATAEAMVTLPTGFLGSMLSLVCFSGEDHISLTIDQSVLRVELGGKHAVQLTAETGDGHCAMVFTRDVLHRLWTDLRPQLIQQREARAVCHIDRAQATLCVAGPGFQLSCPGRVL
jgi:hypothetical protein